VLLLGIQLALSVRQESQTWDEGDHIFAGYMSWTRADFGLNPEHPPLLKLLASALSRVQKAQNFLAAGRAEQALSEAQAALALAPEAVRPRMMMGDVLAASGRREEARAEYEKALSLAKTIEPEFQVRSVPDIERKLAGQ
jgi:tetratricopeptide (TPR) repeat protein